MKPQDVQAGFVATLVDEWVRTGITHAVVCPGSRSTPLALALAARTELTLHVHHDERSAGFMALGMGLATGIPAVVVTTSGTAAAELHPAVVEAHEAGVPLLVCTADRPPELRDVGAPQTIVQTGLFGGSVRWFADPGVPEQVSADRWRALAGRAAAEAYGPVAGPVHLNLPFREPLTGQVGELPAARTAAGAEPRPWVQSSPAASADVTALRVFLRDRRGQRGVLVAGGGSARVSALGEELGWPVLADPRSGDWGAGSTNVVFADAILRSDRARAELRPDVIVRFGEPPASRVVNEWCAGSGAEEVVVSQARWSDPSARAALMVRGDPVEVATVLVTTPGRPGGPDPRLARWREQWAAVSAAARAAVRDVAESLPGFHEPGAARALVGALPVEANLVVSSSMPVRDMERYVEPRSDLRVLANRGANGIDGVVSTALGVAIATGQPSGLLIGDVAFLHDSNGLLGAAHRGADLVIVVVDNDGGGIFSFLPQAGELSGDRFERLFGTPHGLDLVAMARAYGVGARRVDGEDVSDLGKQVEGAVAHGGVQVLVVGTDRAENVAVHRALDEAVAVAVDRVLR